MPSRSDTVSGTISDASFGADCLEDQAPETGAGAGLHVAIIMDGNGRWAKSRNQIRTFGHHAGVNALRRTIKSAPGLGISHLTVYAFSTENWRRPVDEVSDLMGLLRAFIRADLDRMHKEGVRVRIIGQVEGLPKDIINLVRDAEIRTQNNKGLGLQVALNYGAQADILQAAKAFAQKVAAGEAKPQDLTPESFAEGMTTRGLPPLDLLIRTSGEHRLSNFLLWEAAYAEFVFQDILWPDYDVNALQAALDIYRSRDRRFGGLSVPVSGRV
jgi:undecaprenyl diphosphate synthase